MTAPGLRREASWPSGSYPRSANTSAATRRPDARPAFRISDPGSPKRINVLSNAATARAMASASWASFTAIVKSAPCGFTCCRRTPSAAATPATAAI